MLTFSCKSIRGGEGGKGVVKVEFYCGGGQSGKVLF